jgi:putative colanic acid biosynthesis glycosyltransferase
MPLTIFQIGTSFSRGGAALSAKAIGAAMVEMGWDVRQLSKEKPEFLLSNLDVLVSEIPRYYLNVLAYRLFGVEGFLNGAFWTGQLGAFDGADLIHLHNVHGYYMPLDILEKMLSMPCVWTLHDYWIVTGGPGSPLPALEDRSKLERLLSFANLRYPAEWIDRSNQRRQHIFQLLERFQPSLVSVSQNMAENLRSMGLPAGEIAVIPHGIFDTEIPPSISDRSDARRMLGWPNDSHVFLFCAAHVDSTLKGCSLFLKALASISPRSKWRAYVVGDRCARAIAEARRLNLRNVHFCGNVANSRMKYLFRACDTYVAPSLSETYGRTIIEALGEGTFVVCSDLPVFKETSLGLASSFPTCDVIALKEKLDEAIGRGILTDNLMAAAFIRRSHSIQAMAEKYAALYLSTVSNH